MLKKDDFALTRTIKIFYDVPPSIIEVFSHHVIMM